MIEFSACAVIPGCESWLMDLGSRSSYVDAEIRLLGAF